MTTNELKNAFRFHLQTLNYPSFGAVHPDGKAVRALYLARHDIAEGKNRFPAALRPFAAVTWQPDNRKLAHVEKPDNAGLRYIGRVMPETGRNGIWDSGDKCGWHTDPYGDVFRDGTGLCYGVVYQLPGRNGESRYVAGYEFGGIEGGPTLDMSEIYIEPRGERWGSDECPTNQDAARSAAHAADSMAERAAEQEREYQTAWQAGNQYADLSQEIDETRFTVKELLAERKQVKRDSVTYPALCNVIRNHVASLLSRIDELRNERDELKSGDNERLCFWTGDKRLQDAFNEAAGKEVLA